MPDNADAVIIGGGVIGASVAYHLAEAGCTNTIIIERGARQGMGSTGRATGGVRAQFATDINILMSIYSIDFLSKFEDATGHPSGYEPRGYLFIATNHKQLVDLTRNRERQIMLGLKNVEILTPEDISRMVPQLRVDDVVGGSFCQTDGFISAISVMNGFTASAVKRGVRLLLDTEVVGIETDSGAITGVITTRGNISTRAVVCAAGAWAAKVAGLVEVEIPVFPLRRQLASARLAGQVPARLPMVIDLSDGFHFRPDSTASQTNVMLAWPDPNQQQGFESDYDPRFSNEVLRRAQHRVPSWSNLEIDSERCRAGLYEMTPDHHAIIGEAPGVKGLYLVNGFSGHGVMHSPAAGRMTAEIIMNGHSRFLDAKPLALERFAEGKYIQESSLI